MCGPRTSNISISRKTGLLYMPSGITQALSVRTAEMWSSNLRWKSSSVILILNTVSARCLLRIPFRVKICLQGEGLSAFWDNAVSKNIWKHNVVSAGIKTEK